jgi:tetratricopeptide (TPR) repeat protein
VKVWDARRGTLTCELAVRGSADVQFSPDGRHLVTGSGPDYAVWDVGSWALRRRIPRSGAGGLPGPMAFSPDGRVLAIAKTRSLVQLVEFETGRELTTLEPAGLPNVTALGFSPDGRLLTVTFQTAGIQAWDLGEIRRGLASIGLDWQATSADGPGAPPSQAVQAIEVEDAPWLKPLSRGEALAGSGHWHEAALAFGEAIASGADHAEAWTRLALLQWAEGDRTGYQVACRKLLQAFDAAELKPRLANEIAWACAVGSEAVDDYTRVVRLAEVAATGGSPGQGPSTLGAALFRAGRLEEAVRHLDRSVEVQGADGSPFDALFLAMAHQRLGRVQEARDWLRRGTAASPPAMQRPGKRGDGSWMTPLGLALLRREATSLIGSAGR